ncbi:hypothetical protein SAMN05216370_3724 [Pseudomonas peli]|uniref:Uncharacterized protein n=1 Tax=Pseudomonas peli TaxID=592361 RepID=A0AB37ZBG2_9PSED|nr:hypothetical protein [Pseudomonas peli]NMZ70969.1 hypothetical protein [Pseudomonas peli]SCW81916.1 hypothetical protein SAMN05216370_3724 [Pseudomonas peli]
MLMEEIQNQIPYYLTREAGEGILKELENYSEKTQIILNRGSDGVLQGDGWRGFRLYDFNSAEVRNTRGIVISNSCDIDTENKRDLPAKITFAPLIRMKKIEEIFKNSGLDANTTEQKLRSIREQKSTSFFFIPSQIGLDDEYVIWFNDMHSMPMSSFVESAEREKIFTLNMTGFYLLLFKISIHFCRFHENVDRMPAAQYQ